MASRGEHGRPFVNLEPSLVARVAAESFGFDTSRPVLPPLYGLNLPELRYLSVAD